MSYTGVDWRNKPNTTSPINATNLEIMDTELVYLDGEVTSIKGDNANTDRTLDYVTGITGYQNDLSDDFTFTDGSGVDYNTGYTHTSLSWGSVSRMIEVPKGCNKLLLTMPYTSSATILGCAFYRTSSYTASGSYIAGVRCGYGSAGIHVQEKTINIPEEARYFRTTWFVSTSEYYSDYEFKAIFYKESNIIPEDESVTYEKLDSNLKSSVGEIAKPKSFEKSHYISVTGAEAGGLTVGEIGTTLVLNSTSGRRRGYIAVNPGESYLIRVKYTSGSKGYYAAAVDDNLVIKERYLSNAGGSSALSNYIPCIIPEGATKLYFMSALNTNDQLTTYFKPIPADAYLNLEDIFKATSLYGFEKLDCNFVKGALDNGKEISSNTRVLSNKIRCGKGTKIFYTKSVSASFSIAIYNFYTGYYEKVVAVGSGVYVCDNDCIVRMYVYNYLGNAITDDDITALNDSFLVSHIPALIEKKGMIRDANVPDYYYTDDYYPDIITAVRSHETDCGANGDQFVFFTDYHTDTNFGISPVLIQNIIKNTSIKNVIFGGDAITQYSDMEDAKQEIQNFRDDFWFVDSDHWYPVIGNHELNDPGETHAERRLTYSEAYANLIKEIEYKIIPIADYLYYVDNKAQKIRYFHFGCTYQGQIPSATISAFLDALKDVPDGYYVIVISHVGMTAADTISQYFTAVIDGLSAFNQQSTYTYNSVEYDYSETNGIVIMALTGHIHRDYSMQIDNSFYIVATMCDTALGNYTRTRGTITEQSFDLVQIDKTNRTIYLTRVGAGADRTFTF